jgi:hypothetical protein
MTAAPVPLNGRTGINGLDCQMSKGLDFLNVIRSG